MCVRLAFVDGFVTNAPDRTDEMYETHACTMKAALGR